MVQACHTQRQPLQTHPLGHRGGWAMPWSTEEMLDGQYQRVDIPAHARAAHKGLLQKKREKKKKKTGRSLLSRPLRSPDDPVGQGTELKTLVTFKTSRRSIEAIVMQWLSISNHNIPDHNILENANDKYSEKARNV